MESVNKDLTPGFRIIKKNGRLGSNWNVYVPIEAEKNNYQYTVKDVKAGQAYDFVVKAVDERDNSTPSFVITNSIKPKHQPILRLTMDLIHMAGLDVPGYSEPTDYEYSFKNGQTWKQVRANPKPVRVGEI